MTIVNEGSHAAQAAAQECNNFEIATAIDHKICSRCRRNLEVINFTRSKCEKDGLQRWCRECRRIHVQKTTKERREYRLLHVYGISLDAYNKMLVNQGGKCACCGRSDPGGHGAFHVDHCHETREVRGLLCTSCNTGIGLLGDNLNSLLRAVRYLEQSA